MEIHLDTSMVRPNRPMQSRLMLVRKERTNV